MWRFAGVVVAVLLGGCAATSTGVEQTLIGVASKTFTEPLQTVHDATVESLNRMAMDVVEQQETMHGRHIRAMMARRTIDIDLERLSDNATYMRVVATKPELMFRDSATATEVIIQTAQSVQDRRTRVADTVKPTNARAARAR
jgi:hypothetical protein